MQIKNFYLCLALGLSSTTYAGNVVKGAVVGLVSTTGALTENTMNNQIQQFDETPSFNYDNFVQSGNNLPMVQNTMHSFIDKSSLTSSHKNIFKQEYNKKLRKVEKSYKQYKNGAISKNVLEKRVKSFENYTDNLVNKINVQKELIIIDQQPKNLNTPHLEASIKNPHPFESTTKIAYIEGQSLGGTKEPILVPQKTLQDAKVKELNDRLNQLNQDFEKIVCKFDDTTCQQEKKRVKLINEEFKEGVYDSYKNRKLNYNNITDERFDPRRMSLRNYYRLVRGDVPFHNGNGNYEVNFINIGQGLFTYITQNDSDEVWVYDIGSTAKPHNLDNNLQLSNKFNNAVQQICGNNKHITLVLSHPDADHYNRANLILNNDQCPSASKVVIVPSSAREPTVLDRYGHLNLSHWLTQRKALLGLRTADYNYINDHRENDVILRRYDANLNGEYTRPNVGIMFVDDFIGTGQPEIQFGQHGRMRFLNNPNNIANNNHLSTIIKFHINNNGNGVLFTGDATSDSEVWISNNAITNTYLRSTVVQIPHHGSSSHGSNSANFLNRTLIGNPNPGYAVISSPAWPNFDNPSDTIDPITTHPDPQPANIENNHWQSVNIGGFRHPWGIVIERITNIIDYHNLLITGNNGDITFNFNGGNGNLINPPITQYNVNLMTVAEADALPVRTYKYEP